MFDLTPTPAQSAAVAAAQALRKDIRDRARELNEAGSVPTKLCSGQERNTNAGVART